MTNLGLQESVPRLPNFTDFLEFIQIIRNLQAHKLSKTYRPLHAKYIYFAFLQNFLTAEC